GRARNVRDGRSEDERRRHQSGAPTTWAPTSTSTLPSPTRRWSVQPQVHAPGRPGGTQVPVPQAAASTPSQVSPQAGSTTPSPQVDVPVHTPSPQTSPAVHGSPSSHGAALSTCTHPPAARQSSSVHTSPSSHGSGAPPRQVPAAHASSVVQAL